MDKNYRVLIYVDSINRAKFFYKFKKFFEEEGKEVFFITNKLSVKFLIKEAILLKECKKNFLPKEIFEKSLSVLNNYHTLNEAVNIGSCVYETAKKIQPDEIWIWNGSTTIEKTLKYYAEKNNIKKLFFEISNIENRVFVDREGISGDSLLYKHADVLDKFEIDVDSFYIWRNNYLNSKNKVSKKLRSKIPFYALIDSIGYFMGILKEDRRDKSKLFINRLKNKVIELPTQKPDYSKKYILVPLQVSNDSQVKIHSKYKNEDLIKKAIELANEDEYIYIKPHPAEDDIKEIEKIKSFLNDKVVLVNDNIFKLLNHAQKVIVNNSTVGMEALILEKEVIVLGNAYYKKFDFKRTVSFIQNYLSNIKYPNFEITKENYLSLRKYYEI